ncbi:hypothetical protein BV898_04175 [Hypsibius exemplaris]|uniref:G-protein coupled receptors family 1 profile domain-containing protein n=1 Tax=Hypsibius exemplaris TaxID=2072580 RepID=A0A1W0X3S8_HYPEX|nr:hypothetical protein BV898_04175 [Hypsibius exemplaris]
MEAVEPSHKVQSTDTQATHVMERWTNRSTRNATFNANLLSDHYIADPISENAKLNRLLLIPVLSIVIYFLGVLFNGTVLAVFAKNPALRTPFNVYVINLFLGNLGTIAFQLPFTIVHLATGLPERPRWLYNDSVCNLFIWASQGMVSCPTGCHKLIAISRLWAVLFPIHFRTHHSLWTAVCLCVVAWVAIGVFGLIGMAVDAVLYRKSIVPYVCIFNVKAMPVFCAIALFLFVVLPEAVVVASLPIIGVVKLSRGRKQQHRRHIGPVLPNNGQAGGPTAGAHRCVPGHCDQGLHLASLVYLLAKMNITRSRQWHK